MPSEIFYHKSDKVSIPLLIEKVSHLTMFHSYSDSIKVGGDDSLFDYLYVFTSDAYVHGIIVKVLSPRFTISHDIFWIKIDWHHDRGVARHPKEGLYYYDPHLEFRLWLFAELQKIYNETEHIEKQNVWDIIYKEFFKVFYVTTEINPYKNIYGQVLQYNFRYSLVKFTDNRIVDTVLRSLTDFNDRDEKQYRIFASFDLLGKHCHKFILQHKLQFSLSI